MKRALVLAGGGSRGAYQIGVWQALRELDWNFDLVTGTSVGAINGAAIAMGEFDLAVELWKKLNTSSVFDLSAGKGEIPSYRDFVRAFLKEGGAGITPLKKILEETYDLNQICEGKIELGIMTFNLTKRRPETVFVSQLRNSKEKLIDYILASASIFPALKIYKIGTQKYVDGGYYNKMPIDMAIEKGAKEIIAVDLEAVGFTRNYRLEEAKIKYIKPYWDLGSMLSFDPETARRNIRLGYLDTMKSFYVFDGRAYALVKNQFARFYQNKKRTYEILCRQLGFFSKNEFLSKQAGKMTGHKGNLTKVPPEPVKEYSLKVFLFSAMEQAAEILGLNPEKIYTLPRLNQLLLSSYHKIPVAPAIIQSHSVRDLFDQKTALKFLTQVILEHNRQSGSVKLGYLSRLFPKEIKGAMYLALLLL